mmetsp:Transcript_4189/g.8968  ORF Transcript_4189/g.8968 Transcript_4189/m.8968 type:complete len:211 (-) Transcript_4189:28-660(-)
MWTSRASHASIHCWTQLSSFHAGIQFARLATTIWSALQAIVWRTPSTAPSATSRSGELRTSLARASTIRCWMQCSAVCGRSIKTRRPLRESSASSATRSRTTGRVAMHGSPCWGQRSPARAMMTLRTPVKTVTTRTPRRLPAREAMVTTSGHQARHQQSVQYDTAARQAQSCSRPVSVVTAALLYVSRFLFVCSSSPLVYMREYTPHSES